MIIDDGSEEVDDTIHEADWFRDISISDDRPIVSMTTSIRRSTERAMQQITFVVKG